MQSEFIAEARDGLAVGGFQFDPDETVRPADMVADVVKGDRAGCGVLEEQAVDDGLRGNVENGPEF